MLVDEKLKLFEACIKNATPNELLWMNDYLNGIVKNKLNAAEFITTKAPKKITLVYGTETGNSKKMALNFAAKAKQNNLPAKLISLDQYRLNDLPKEEYLLAVISTHGEGEPPVAAKKFYEYIHTNELKLEKIQYSVLALGDTAYPLFCKTGEEVDLQLNKLGARRIAPLQKCDVEYEEDANNWFDNILKKLTTEKLFEPIINTTPTTQPVKKNKQIYAGKILTSINLNDKGSNKETYHIEIEANDVQYQCGDSIGIIAENDEQVVDDIIAVAKVDAEKILEFKKEKFTIYNLLKTKINISHLTERLVQQYATITEHNIPVVKTDLLSLIKNYPVKNAEQFQEILVGLNSISPRLYTIASAPEAHPGEIHIVVVKDNYFVKEEKKWGLCSNYLANLKIDSLQHFFVQPNKKFRLPAPDKNIIMVGPGTGIAAFRSFLAEREATGAAGKNWLFFGEQHFASDFLYQTEIQNWAATGLLTKVDVAFSRDQKEKIYVQHKMIKQGAEIFDWITNGAYFFVCGKKHPMSHDVENTLLQIFQQQGNKTAEEAKAFLQQLEDEGRYEKDVY